MIEMKTIAGSLKLLGLYAIAAACGYGCFVAGLPLPWMIGPLLVTGVLTFAGVIDIQVPTKSRPFGQAVVASQVGLSFSPVVFASLLDTAPLLVLMAFMTIIVGFAVALTQSRMAQIPLSLAVLATLPTSPVEAAVVAERYSFPVAQIILSQTMRIAAVVVLIPTAIYYIDGPPDAGRSLFYDDFDLLGTLTLGSLAAMGMFIFNKLRISNPYFLGPLALSSAVTAAGIDLAPYPPAILWAAQMVLGTWMGSQFRRTLFSSAGRMVSASMVCTLIFLGISSLIAVFIAHNVSMEWEMLVLGTAPGGVTEMAVTAKFLGIDVALITAFHLTRIFIVVPCIPHIIDRLRRFEIQKEEQTEDG